jgi:hypothetical protein
MTLTETIKVGVRPSFRAERGYLKARCAMNPYWPLIFAAYLLLATPTAAQEQAVLGQGNVSCRSWLDDRADDAVQSAGRTAWILGYLTGFNKYGSRPRGDVTRGKGTEEIMSRIDDYCSEHPSDNLYQASAALIEELRQPLNR